MNGSIRTCTELGGKVILLIITTTTQEMTMTMNLAVSISTGNLLKLRLHPPPASAAAAPSVKRHVIAACLPAFPRESQNLRVFFFFLCVCLFQMPRERFKISRTWLLTIAEKSLERKWLSVIDEFIRVARHIFPPFPCRPLARRKTAAKTTTTTTISQCCSLVLFFISFKKGTARDCHLTRAIKSK